MRLTASTTKEILHPYSGYLRPRGALQRILHGAFGKCVKAATFTQKSYPDISRVIDCMDLSDLV